MFQLNSTGRSIVVLNGGLVLEITIEKLYFKFPLLIKSLNNFVIQIVQICLCSGFQGEKYFEFIIFSCLSCS